MKMLYNTPSANILLFAHEDVLTSSGNEIDKNDNIASDDFELLKTL